MRDMDLKLLVELNKILPDPEPETVQEDTRNEETTKRRKTK